MDIGTLRSVPFGCADATIHIDTNDTPERTAVELARQASLQLGFNCHGSAKDAGLAHAANANDVVEIAYAADDWKGTSNNPKKSMSMRLRAADAQAAGSA